MWLVSYQYRPWHKIKDKIIPLDALLTLVTIIHDHPAKYFAQCKIEMEKFKKGELEDDRCDEPIAAFSMVEIPDGVLTLEEIAALEF
jgi:hypothetical protein